MPTDPITSTHVETRAHLKQLCKDARELRETAQELRASNYQLRLRCQAAVYRAQASRALAAELTMPQPQALNC